MLFKLISDGLKTGIELDGQRIEQVHSVTFTHTRDQDMNDCRVTIEFDLSRKQGTDFRNCHVFEPAGPGQFVKLVRRYEEYEEEFNHDCACGVYGRDREGFS